LNENAKDFVPEFAPYTIVEGGVKPEEWEYQKEKSRCRKDIIYAGALTDYSGIVQLIEAMREVKHSDIKLQVYGNGYLVDWVKNQAAQYANIVYMGVVPNNEMRGIQQQCLLLVNPRPTDSDIARYTFPSKILEYLASGTPVLTSRLNGIPREYDRYLSYIDTVDGKGIAKAIDKFFDGEYGESLHKAEEGKKFVLTQKSWYAQGKKIIHFIEEQEKGGEFAL
jgi:glycosyltransferase involved in cell wall biosynthesis